MQGLPDLTPSQLTIHENVKPEIVEKSTIVKSDQVFENVFDKFIHYVNAIISGEREWSYSSASNFLKSPRHFYISRTDPPKQTKAMIEGQQFHMAVLEPELFKETYWIFDDFEKVQELIAGGSKKPRATAEYKRWKEEEEIAHLGKEIIDAELYKIFLKMGDELHDNDASGPLMAQLTGKEIKHHCEIDGIKFVCKIDGEGDNIDESIGYPLGQYTVDVKKVADARFKKIKWDIFDRNYDMQGALYTFAKGVKTHFLLFIDKDYNITVVQLTAETLEGGMDKLHGAIENLQYCLEENKWSSSYDFYQKFVLV